MTTETIFSNARVVLPDEVITGTVAVTDGVITDISSNGTSAPRHDCDGDILMPGLIELHTDHLEHHLKPRPKVDWPQRSALIAFDSQIAASGITTVFDCLRAGSDVDNASFGREVKTILDVVQQAQNHDLLRAEHRIHIRCEICADDVLDDLTSVLELQKVSLMSLMDHTPGARQFVDVNKWRTYYGGKTGSSADEMDRLIASRREQFSRNYKAHRRALVEMAREREIVLASHDDAKPEHVDESIKDAVSLAEFPTTMEAARLSQEAGIDVMMGAPNVVRGGSHSGNIAAEDLARAGHLDVLSSDYVPASLLLGAFELARRVDDIDLPTALRTVTYNPARAIGLDDRGEIARGNRADLVRVHLKDELPIVREVYRGGQRVI